MQETNNFKILLGTFRHIDTTAGIEIHVEDHGRVRG
jgi:hypothetical protein